VKLSGKESKGSSTGIKEYGPTTSSHCSFLEAGKGGEFFPIRET